MKRFLILAAACIPLIAGCRNAREKDAIPAVVEHAKPEKSQAPYYYGLIEEYRTILAEDSNNLAAIIALGNAYFESGAWRDAIHQYEHALKLDPRNADVHCDMGTAFRNIAMPDRAMAEYKLALQYEPGHLNARYGMGLVYAYDRHDYRSATRIWEDLLRISPSYPEADDMRTRMQAFGKGPGKGRPQ